jgi:hypothetical protein
VYPFYSRNPDKTLSIGFHATKKGDIDVKIIYENVTPLSLSTTIKVSSMPKRMMQLPRPYSYVQGMEIGLCGN